MLLIYLQTAKPSWKTTVVFNMVIRTKCPDKKIGKTEKRDRKATPQTSHVYWLQSEVSTILFIVSKTTCSISGRNLVSLAYGSYIKGYFTIRCEAYISFQTICQSIAYKRKPLYTVSFFLLYVGGLLTVFSITVYNLPNAFRNTDCRGLVLNNTALERAGEFSSGHRCALIVS